jgi:hypothetical protein
MKRQAAGKKLRNSEFATNEQPEFVSRFARLKIGLVQGSRFKVQGDWDSLKFVPVVPEVPLFSMRFALL